MAERYCRIVGVLGAPDSGKTALLASLYLLLAHGRLDGFEYADSRTLMAFEEISKGSRRWNNGYLPDQLTAHTHLADERTPGFLHLKLRPINFISPTTDLLIPDVPGEWTESLIDQARSDRWEFLKAADALWIMIDGRNLIDGKQMLTIHRIQRLVDRLAALLSPHFPPIFAAITRHDLVNVPEDVLGRLQSVGRTHGAVLSVQRVASFSGPGSAVAAGAGLAALVSATATVIARAQPKSTNPSKDYGAHRELLRFHCHQGPRQ